MTGRIIRREYYEGSALVTASLYGYNGSGGSQQLIKNLNGEVVKKFVSLPGGVNLTTNPNKSDASQRIFSLSNLHGDVMATVNMGGVITGKYITGPFGEKLPNNPFASFNQQQGGSDSPDNADDNSTFSHLGQHKKVTEDGLELEPIQMGARVYIPILGRFLQVDPVEGGCLNNYVYAMDPVNQRDLSGRAIFDWVKKAFDIAKEVVISAKYYVHWLFGRGKSRNYDNPEIQFKITGFKDRISKKKRTEKIANKDVYLQTIGVTGSETIGGAKGKASGVLIVDEKGWYFKGQVTNITDSYDFDIRWQEGLTARNGANIVGNIGGGYCTLVLPYFCTPQDYIINIEGVFYGETYGTFD